MMLTLHLIIMANDNEIRSDLQLISYNMHGFTQGYPVLEDLVTNCRLDMLLLQEHWLTPANLSKFDDCFTDFFSFGCSAMSHTVGTGMMCGRPFGGVITLINNRLRKFTQTIYCEERFCIVRVANYLFVNVYMPCRGTADRLAICDDILASVWAWRTQFHWCECVVSGDFNVNLDSSDIVASRLLRFITDCSLVRCDDIFPLQKSVTYVNLALSHQSCIDYILTSADRSVNLRFWTRTLTFRIIFRCWLSYHVPI